MKLTPLRTSVLVIALAIIVGLSAGMVATLRGEANSEEEPPIVYKAKSMSEGYCMATRGDDLLMVDCDIFSSVHSDSSTPPDTGDEYDTH